MGRRSARVLVATFVAVLISALAPAAAVAAPDQTVTLTEAEPEQSWNGAVAVGTNQDYNGGTGEPCPDEPANPDEECDKTLIHVNTPYFVDIQVTLDDDPANDFDLFIYESDAEGNRGALIDSSAFIQTIGEEVTVEGAQGYYLVQVVYYQTAGGYSATAEIAGRTTRQLLLERRGAGAGTVTGQGIDCGGDCSERFDHGTQVTLTANPGPGSRFVSWGGDCSGARRTCTVTLDGDQIVRAAFEPGAHGAPAACARGGGNVVVGTPGNDVLPGSPGVDVICGLGGKDRLRGRGGADLLIGGPGKDELRGGAGRDRCRGGRGRDVVKGCENRS